MRKLITAAATALTLGLAAPALADHNSGPNYGQNQNDDDNYGRRDRDGQRGDYDRRDRDGQRGDYDRRDRDDRNFDRNEHNLDRWERGWRHDERQDYRHHRTLSYGQIVHRLEHQGYYGVRGLRPARWGFGWRAFAYTGRGQPVMLRVNPYTGRVLEARYLWS